MSHEMQVEQLMLEYILNQIIPEENLAAWGIKNPTPRGTITAAHYVQLTIYSEVKYK